MQVDLFQACQMKWSDRSFLHFRRTRQKKRAGKTASMTPLTSWKQNVCLFLGTLRVADPLDWEQFHCLSVNPVTTDTHNYGGACARGR